MPSDKRQELLDALDRFDALLAKKKREDDARFIEMLGALGEVKAEIGELRTLTPTEATP
jgi:hypothetical protein